MSIRCRLYYSPCERESSYFIRNKMSRDVARLEHRNDNIRVALGHEHSVSLIFHFFPSFLTDAFVNKVYQCNSSSERRPSMRLTPFCISIVAFIETQLFIRIASLCQCRDFREKNVNTMLFLWFDNLLKFSSYPRLI